MVFKYQVFFVPLFKDRKKLSSLRVKLCKSCKSNEALQYPVHMSFVLGVRIKNYKQFETELKNICSKEKPQTLVTSKYIMVHPQNNWAGIHIKHTKELELFKGKITKLINKYSSERKLINFIPYITFVSHADVSKLKKIKNPVQNLLMDGITIAKREKLSKPYRIHKFIKFS